MMSGRRPAIARSIARVIFSPTTTPMLPPMKAYSMAATTRLDAVDAPGRRDDRVVEAGGGDAGVETLVIRLGVGELERVGGRQPVVEFLPLAVVERPKPFRGAQPEVMRALRADAQAGREVLVVDDLPAGWAFDPEPFGHPALLVGWLNGLALLLEPGHSGKIGNGHCRPSCRVRGELSTDRSSPRDGPSRGRGGRTERYRRPWSGAGLFWPAASLMSGSELPEPG